MHLECYKAVVTHSRYSGVSRISARGVLKVRPHTKSGGADHFRSDIRKVGGQSTSGPIYEKWGGGGGGGQFASGPIRKVGGGASPLQVRYLCLAHRKYFIVNYKRLQF